MPHALLSGIGGKTDKVAELLCRWGMTCERLDDRLLDPDDFSPTRCDVIIAVCASGADPAPFPSLANSGARHVPLLLVGGNHGTSRHRVTATEHIDSPGRDGEWLRAALMACLGLDFCDDSEAARLGQLRDYFHYLNHELRTPLTAAQTALQILSAEIGEVAANSAQHDVACIALRNLKRLGDTLQDTESCLTERSCPSAPDWRETTAGDLLADALESAGLDASLEAFDNPDEATAPAIGDPALLGVVLRQVHGALTRYCAQSGFTLSAELSGCEEMKLSWASDVSAEFSKVSRTGLISERAGNETELIRLIQFSLSHELLQVLGGRIKCDESGSLRVELALSLKAGEGIPAAAETISN